MDEIVKPIETACQCNLELSVSAMFFYVVCGGALGGLMDFFSRFNFKHHAQGKMHFQDIRISTADFWSLFGLGLFSAFLGIGGAFAVQFVLIGINKFEAQDIATSILWLFTTCVVAGYSGRRMLSLVSSKLEEQVGKAKEEADKAKEEADEAKAEARVAKDESDTGLLITRASAAIGPHSTMSERIALILELRAFLKVKPTHRYLTILAARLCRRDENYEDAVDILSEFVKVKEKLGQHDKDFADVLYNRACYHALIASTANYDNKDAIEACLKDLASSVAISKENAADAKSDEDFKFVEGLPEFQQILAISDL